MNEISKILDKISKDKDFIDLIATNFLKFSIDNGFSIPQEVFVSTISDYFNKHSYNPEPKGLTEARESISKYYKINKLEIDKEDIIITASTSESYSQIFMNFTKPGDEILFPNPSYPLFEYIAKYSNIIPKFYELDEENNWDVDLEKLEESITKKTKGIVLISPNNPTGSIINENLLEKIISLAQKNNLFIIFDEVFSEFKDVEIFPRPSTNYKANIFILNGISKMLALPDLKLAWIAVIGANKEKIVNLLETTNDTYLNANYLSQFILPKIIAFRDNISHNINAVLKANKATLNKFLSTYSKYFSGNIGKGGIHCVLKTNLDIDEEKLIIDLLNIEKLSLHPGYFYDIKSKSNSPHLVISLLQDKEVFKKALQKLAEFISL